MNIAIEKLKNPPAALLIRAKNVFDAQAEIKRISVPVVEIQNKVLNSLGAASIDDLAFSKFKAFDERYHAALTAAGFDVDFGVCPLLNAENALRIAKEQLAREAEDITGIKTDTIMRRMKYYYEYVNLLLDICAKRL